MIENLIKANLHVYISVTSSVDLFVVDELHGVWEAEQVRKESEGKRKEAAEDVFGANTS